MLFAMNKQGINFLLVVFILVETLCYTYLQQTGLYYSSSVLYFLSGLGICFLPLLLPTSESQYPKRNFFVAIAFLILISILLIPVLSAGFQKLPLDYHIADMLPRIKIYATRFLHGSYVYDDVTEIWGGNLPPYFPATWAPYIPAVLFGFDMRWITVTAFLTAVFMMLFMLRRQTGFFDNFTTLVLLVSLFFLVNYNMYFGSEIWVLSYEALIAFYYVLLCLAIISWNPYLIGGAITFCVLSRFSLSFWVPAFLIFLWWNQSFQFALKTGGTIAVAVLCLFVLPFVVGHLDAFGKIIEQYQSGSAVFWDSNNIDGHGYREVGLFKFFTASQSHLLRPIQLVSTIVAPIFFMGAAVKFLPTFKNKNILIGLCSLKFTLLFFYNFLNMPFHYLFITPTVISYPIAIYYLMLSKEPETA